MISNSWTRGENQNCEISKFLAYRYLNNQGQDKQIETYKNVKKNK